MSTSRGQLHRIDRSSFPKSATATAVSRLTSRAPFASTLRPNLTGGALPRTAGGYSIGGGRINGARHFSHTPAAPAQVVNNVSAAVRAFWLSGHKAQFNGVDRNGEKQYRVVSDLHAQTTAKLQSMPKFAPGAFVDFEISPTVTALSPLGAGFPSDERQLEQPTLNTSGFLDVLSVDFSRALKDLAAIMNDLKRLSTLGDLTIEMASPTILRIRFPGCDAESVERLCDEVNVTRGIIHQDANFDESSGAQVALMFPFAPTSEHTLSSPGGSLRSQTGHDIEDFEELYSEVDEMLADNTWIHSPEGYESLEDVSETESTYFNKYGSKSKSASTSEYDGVEGIYRFLEQCDSMKRVLR